MLYDVTITKLLHDNAGIVKKVYGTASLTVEGVTVEVPLQPFLPDPSDAIIPLAELTESTVASWVGNDSVVLYHLNTLLFDSTCTAVEGAELPWNS